MSDVPGRRLGTRTTAAAIAALTVVALVARLVVLDNRVAHWDEARVAWWQLDHLRTGTHEYRPIIHGPFLGIVNRYLFEQLGPTDVVMRLPVAVIGGLLPATAWLLRDRLGDVVTVALAAFLAANPLLLYYSRFVRNDVLVAAFMFAAFGCLVRLYDRRQPRYLYGALALVALGFTTKENALLYVAAWIGAAGLLLDHRLLFEAPREVLTRARRSIRAELGGLADVRSAVIDRTIGWKTRWTGHLLLAALLAVLVLVFFYAPRDPETGVGLWELTPRTVIADPGAVGNVIDTALRGSAEDFLGQWGKPQENPYLEFLGDYLKTMWAGAAALSLLAVGGLLYDRWGGHEPSPTVAFAGYWGLASVVGYPLATDIKAPWAAVHAVVALAIPAAVALALLCRWTVDAADDGDRPAVAAGAVVLLIVSGGVIAPAVGAAYQDPTDRDNEIVQYAQPQNELRPVVDRMERVVVANEGPDVLFHGSYFVDGDTTATRTPACVKWFNALPLPWYLNRSDARVQCTDSRNQLETALEDPPPVVLTRTSHNETVATRLPSGYKETQVELRLWGTETSFFFRSTTE